MKNISYDEYIGSHGTTFDRWLLIKENNTFCYGEGERGTGVYFWEKNDYAKSLAIAWYVNRRKKQKCNQVSEQNCAIIWATIKVNKGLIIDFNESKWRNYVLKLLKKNDNPDNREETCKIYDLVCEKIEQQLKNKIKLVITSVYPPSIKKVDIYPTQIVGMATCYVVKDPKCIDNLKCEEIRKFDFHDSDEIKVVLKEIENET